MRKSKFLIIINVMRQTFFFAVHKNHMKNVYPKLKKKLENYKKIIQQQNWENLRHVF